VDRSLISYSFSGENGYVPNQAKLMGFDNSVIRRSIVPSSSDLFAMEDLSLGPDKRLNKNWYKYLNGL